MTTMAVLVAMAALGVDSGYEPAADGQLEYIVQIEPQLVAPLAKGQDITSELPRGLDVRHFRVTIGTGKLPRQVPSGRSTRNRFPAIADGPATAPGVETQDVRVGYNPLDKQNGEYVIEITPTGLGDLNQHDLTGDIPADLTVTRMRISTQPGSAPTEPTPASQSNPQPANPSPPNLSPALAEPGQLAAQPQPGPPAAGGIGPAVPVSAASGATQGGSDQSEQPLEPLTALEQSELSHPEDDPNFQWPPDPLAQNASTGPGAPPPGQPQIRTTPQYPAQNGTSGAAQNGNAVRGNNSPDRQQASPNNYTADGTPQLAGPQRGNAMQGSPRNSQAYGNRAAPDSLSQDPQNSPPPAGTVTFSDGPSSARRTDKPSQPGKRPPSALEKGENLVTEAEEELNAATKAWPWYTLGVTLLLFLSVGGNVYLTWIAWDARNRSRMLLERFHSGELTTT